MSAGALNQLVASATGRFQQRYKRPPQWVAAAPSRVNLIGEHTDYNDGFVLPMAIERYCVIAAGDCPLFSPTDDGPGRNVQREKGTVPLATVFSAAVNEEVAIPLDHPPRHRTPGHWSNYVAGVIAGCGRHNMRPPGFVAIVESNVPVGGGLSSSAALEVAAATLIEAMTGTTLDPAAKASLCRQAEHEYAGVPCGIMDQFASVMGRVDCLMLLDCRSRHIEHIPIVDPNVTVLIINTNVKHELSGGAYAERRGQCESAARKLGARSLRDISAGQLEANRAKITGVEYCRARHVVTEIARTVEAATAARTGDWPTIGALMYAGHESLRDDYEVSCRELDLLVDLARVIGRKGGVFGSRMTGGGFGGCTVSLVETARVHAVSDILADAFEAEFGVEPGLITSRPARGAHVVKTSR
jgi:galactokinase